jgi:hypothetical protein
MRIKNFNAEDFRRKEARKMDRYAQYAGIVLKRVNDAGLI